MSGLLDSWHDLRDEVMAELATITGIDSVLELDNQNQTTQKGAVGFIRIVPEPLDNPSLGGYIPPRIRFQVGGYIKSTDESKTAEIKGDLWIAFLDWIKTLSANNDDFNGKCMVMEMPKTPVVSSNEVSVTFKVQLPE